MNTPEAMLADIARGEHAVALVLADWLEEHGEERRGRLLRVRYRRFVNARAKAIAVAETEVRAFHEQLTSLKASVEAARGLFQAGISFGHYLRDMDTLFVGYCERLVASLPGKGVTS